MLPAVLADILGACRTEAEFVRGVSALLGGRSVVPLVGAGISRRLPTEFPTARELRTRATRAIFRGLDVPASRRLSLLSLETYLQEVADVDEPAALASYAPLRRGTPNANHQFLVEGLACGLLRGVLTTNLDTLIEDAAAQAGVRLDVLLTAADASRWSETSPCLVKLHGCVTRQSSMIITRNHVGRGLASWKREAFIRLAARRHLLVLGYSGQDRLDIVPAMVAARPTSILWIHHAQEFRPPSSTLPVEVPYIPEGIETWAVTCDTGRLLDRLRLALGTRASAVPARPTPPQPVADPWSRLGEPQRYVIAGNLLTRCGDQGEALRAFALAERHLESDLEAMNARLKRSLVLWRMSRLGPARAAAFQVIAEARHRRGPTWRLLESRAWSQAGLADWSKGRYQDQLVALTRSAGIKRRLLAQAPTPGLDRRQVEYLLSGTLNDLSLGLRDMGRWREAHQVLAEAYSIKRRLGEPWGLGVVLGNLALLDLLLRRESLALRRARRALELRGFVGDAYVLALGHLDMATACLLNSRFNEARAMLRAARGIGSHLGQRDLVVDAKVRGADADRLEGSLRSAARRYRAVLHRRPPMRARISCLYGIGLCAADAPDAGGSDSWLRQATLLATRNRRHSYVQQLGERRPVII